jgi:hypothetical protein
LPRLRSIFNLLCSSFLLKSYIFHLSSSIFSITSSY